MLKKIIFLVALVAFCGTFVFYCGGSDAKAPDTNLSSAAPVVEKAPEVKPEPKPEPEKKPADKKKPTTKKK